MAELRIHDSVKPLYKSIKTEADAKHVIVNLPAESGKLGTDKDVESGLIVNPSDLVTYMIKKPDITKHAYIQSDFDVNAPITFDTYTTSEVFLGTHTKTIVQVAIDDKFKLIVTRAELEPTKTSFRLPSIPGYKGDIWVRYRFLSSDVTSEWSDAYKLYYNRKTVVTPKTTIVEKPTELEVTAIPFASVGDGAEPSHEYTNWELVSVNPSGETKLWESKEDRINKTAITIPIEKVKAGEEYILKTTYYTDIEGGESATYHNRFLANEVSLGAPVLSKVTNGVIATPFVAPNSDYEHTKTVWIMSKGNNTLKLTADGNERTRISLSSISGNKIKCYYVIEYNGKEYFTADSNELEVVGTGGVKGNVDSILQGWANGLTNIDGTVKDMNNQWILLDTPSTFQQGTEESYVYIADGAIDQVKLRIRESDLASGLVNLIQNVESASVTMYFRRNNNLVPVGQTVNKNFAKDQVEHVFELKEMLTDASIGKRLADYLVSKANYDLDILYDTDEVDGKTIRSFVIPVTFRIFMSVMGKFINLELNHNLVYKLGTRKYVREVLSDTNVTSYYTTAGRFTSLPNWVYELLSNNKAKYTDGVLINIYKIPPTGIADKTYKELITKEVNTLVRESSGVDGVSLFKIDGLLAGLTKGEYRDIALNINFYNTRVIYRRDYLLYDPEMTIVMDNSLYTVESDTVTKVAGKKTLNILKVDTGHNPTIIPGIIKVLNPVAGYIKDKNKLKVTFTGVDGHVVNKEVDDVLTELEESTLKTQKGIAFNSLNLREQQYSYKLELILNTGLKKEVTGVLVYTTTAVTPGSKPLPPIDKNETLIIRRDGTMEGNWQLHPEVLLLNNPSFTERIALGNTWIDKLNENLTEGSTQGDGIQFYPNDTLSVVIRSLDPIESYGSTDEWKKDYPLFLEDLLDDYKTDGKLALLDGYKEKTGNKEVKLKVMTLKDGDQWETLDVLETNYLYAGYLGKNGKTYKYLVFNIKDLANLKLGDTSKKEKLFQDKEIFWLQLTIPKVDGVDDKVLDIVTYKYFTYYSTGYWPTVNVLEVKEPNYSSQEVPEVKTIASVEVQNLIHREIQLTMPATTDTVELKKRKESWSGVQRGIYLLSADEKREITIPPSKTYPYNGETKTSLQGLLTTTSFLRPVVDPEGGFKTQLVDKSRNPTFAIDADSIVVDQDRNELNAVAVSVRELLGLAGVLIRKEPLTGSETTNCNVPTLVTTYGINPTRVFKFTYTGETTKTRYLTVTPPLTNVSISDLLLGTYNLLDPDEDSLTFSSLGRKKLFSIGIPTLEELKQIVSSPLSPYWFKILPFKQEFTFEQTAFKAWFAGKVITVPIEAKGSVLNNTPSISNLIKDDIKVEIMGMLYIDYLDQTAAEHFRNRFLYTLLYLNPIWLTGYKDVVRSKFSDQQLVEQYDPIRNAGLLTTSYGFTTSGSGYSSLINNILNTLMERLGLPKDKMRPNWNNTNAYDGSTGHLYYKNGKLYLIPNVAAYKVSIKSLREIGVLLDRNIPGYYKKRKDFVLGYNRVRVRCLDIENSNFNTGDFIIKDWENHSLYSDTQIASLGLNSGEYKNGTSTVDIGLNESILGSIASSGVLFPNKRIEVNGRADPNAEKIMRINHIFEQDLPMSANGIELATNANYKDSNGKFTPGNHGAIVNSTYDVTRFNTIQDSVLSMNDREMVWFKPVIEIIPGYYTTTKENLESLTTRVMIYLQLRTKTFGGNIHVAADFIMYIPYTQAINTALGSGSGSVIGFGFNTANNIGSNYTGMGSLNPIVETKSEADRFDYIKELLSSANSQTKKKVDFVLIDGKKYIRIVVACSGQYSSGWQHYSYPSFNGKNIHISLSNVTFKLPAILDSDLTTDPDVSSYKRYRGIYTGMMALTFSTPKTYELTKI